MNIRPAKPTDAADWARMRQELWPSAIDEHKSEIARYFASVQIDVVEALVLERKTGKLGGFIEINIRNYAEGSLSNAIPYVEGWYIDPDLRGMGYGKKLMLAAETWAKEHQFDELASDAEIDNAGSIAAHKALGFMEVDRIVCFLKKLA